MLNFILPPLLIVLAFAGAGHLVLRLSKYSFAEESEITRFCIAYFLGQGILGCALTLLGLIGMLQQLWLLALFLPCAACCLFFLYFGRKRWVSFSCAAYNFYKHSGLFWKLYTVLLLVLFASGITSLGTPMDGDAMAFYMAYPKLLAYTGQFTPLPGYETFSQVGLLAETFIAALNLIGMPDSSARIYSYVNFFPALALLGVIGAKVGIGKRGVVLLIGAAVTSSCAALLWGSGKTDLYAVGPALAAFLFAMHFWDNNKRFQSLVFSGFLAGLACVFKLSYIPSLGVSLCIFAGWPLFFQFFDAAKIKNSRMLRKATLALVLCALFASIGFFIGLLPLFVKNQVLFGSWIGITDAGGTFFSAKTTLRIVLTYPLALVFGRYWAQFGNISILYLLAVPFLLFLQKPVWRDSKLAAISLASFVGIACWIALFPSYLMPRYILFVLFLAAIPLMGGLAQAARQREFWNSCVPLASACVIALTFAGYVRKDIFKPVDTVRYVQTGNDPTDAPAASAGKLISNLASTDDRVYLLSWYRYWLRPDIIQNLAAPDEYAWLNGKDEKDKIPEMFWDRMRTSKHTYVMWDTMHFKATTFEESLSALPQGITMSKLECFDYICVYKIEYAE